MLRIATNDQVLKDATKTHCTLTVINTKLRCFFRVNATLTISHYPQFSFDEIV